MSNVAVPVSKFAGLDLAASPDESACIDQLNIDLDVRGALRVRDGYDNFTLVALGAQPDSLFEHRLSDGTRQLLVGHGGDLTALDTGGDVDTTSSAPTASPHFFTRFGGPTLEATYIGNGTDQVRQFDTVNGFIAPAGLAGQTGRFVAVTPISNRLVVARESGATLGNNPSSVNFSVPGNPIDFTVANGAGFEDLDPGDGEAIMGLVTWRNYVFVFKETKFWVYYGETATSTGAADFLFRKVGAGVGLVASKALTGGRGGVYFLDHSGVYVTTGGDPENISGAIEPLFFGPATHSFYQGDEINQAAISGAAMYLHNERLYLSVPTGVSTVNNRTFVYDPRTGDWLDWDIGAAAFTTFRIGSAPELVFAAAAGDNHVMRHSTAYTSDNGTSITARYRTGFSDLGSAGQEKDIDSTRVWGTGTVALSGSRDFGSLDTAENVVLGTAPAVAASLHNKQKKGELISYQFANVSGAAFRCHRYAFYLRGLRPPGQRSA